MRVRTVVVLAVAAALVAGCSSSGKEKDTVSAPTSAVGTTAPPAESVSPAPSGAIPTGSTASKPPSGSSQPVRVDENFDNPTIGESGTVLEYVRNFPVSQATRDKYSALADREVVLVQVTVQASSKYYSSFGEDSFSLVGNDGTRNAPSTSIVADEMKAAGYPPLQDADTGKSSTGWIAFAVDHGFTHLTLQYESLEYKTSGGKTLPAKTIRIPLV